MAYCVHCGVRLDDSERRCPLCGTPVYDPQEARPADAPRPYPVRTPEQELKKSRRFLMILALFMLGIPALLCLLIDLLLGGGLKWSLYASGALVLLLISVEAPLAAQRHQVYWAVGTSFVCLNLYLFLVEKLSSSSPWFFPISLPALTLGALLLTVIITLYRRAWLNKLTLLAASFAAVAAECFAVEWLYSAAYGKESLFTWSPFVLAPCLFISLALFFINGNRAVREEVRRRVHF